MEGATESEKNELKKKAEPNEDKKGLPVDFEDLDGTGATQTLPLDPMNLDPEVNKTVFMNLIHVDEKAQVSMSIFRLDYLD